MLGIVYQHVEYIFGDGRYRHPYDGRHRQQERYRDVDGHQHRHTHHQHGSSYEPLEEIVPYLIKYPYQALANKPCIRLGFESCPRFPFFFEEIRHTNLV